MNATFFENIVLQDTIIQLQLLITGSILLRDATIQLNDYLITRFGSIILQGIATLFPGYQIDIVVIL